MFNLSTTKVAIPYHNHVPLKLDLWSVWWLPRGFTENSHEAAAESSSVLCEIATSQLLSCYSWFAKHQNLPFIFTVIIDGLECQPDRIRSKEKTQNY